MSAATRGDIDSAIDSALEYLAQCDDIRERLAVHRLLVEWSASLNDSLGAKRFASQAVREGGDHLAPSDPDLLVARHSELYWMCMVGYDSIAEPRFSALIRDIRVAKGEGSDLEWSARMNSAMPAKNSADFESAEKIYRPLVSEMSAALPADDVMMLTARDNLAEVLALAGRPEEAREIYEDLLLIITETFGADDPRTLRVRGEIAQCHHRCGRVDLARRQWEQLALDAERALGSHDDRSVHFRCLVIAAALDAHDDAAVVSWCAPLVDDPPRHFTEIEREGFSQVLVGAKRRLALDVKET